MKSIELHLHTRSGDQLDAIALEGFGIAQDWDESPGGNNQEIIERVSALYETMVTLLRERQAAPERGRTCLKFALGEALLTAHEQEGDVVIDIIVRPLGEGENDGLDESD